MKLLFLGDLLYNYDEIQPDIKEMGKYFKSNNYHTILNLEAPLKSNTPIKKWINLYQSERIFETLKLLNVKAVCLSNNHIMDWGKEGLDQLINKLAIFDISYFGAGLNLTQALKPIILKINNCRFGLLGFGWDEEMCVYAKENKGGVAPLNKKIIIETVKKLRNKVDILVVNLHWGYEYEVYPLPLHRKLAHDIIDTGADLIIGHHAHVIQAYEEYKSKNIYYGLGNFYFGDRRETFNKNNVGLKFSKYGLGVLYNKIANRAENIYFKYENNRTKIIEYAKLENISTISLTDYSNSYWELRTTHYKPILYAGKYQYYINNFKLNIFKFKKMIINLAIKSFIKLRIFNFVKKMYKK